MLQGIQVDRIASQLLPRRLITTIFTHIPILLCLSIKYVMTGTDAILPVGYCFDKTQLQWLMGSKSLTTTAKAFDRRRYCSSTALFNRRIRHHVNPLSYKYRQPKYLENNWIEASYENPCQSFHIDIGSGSGKFCIEMAKAYPSWNFLGIDIRLAVVEKATVALRKEGITNCHFICGNCDVDFARIAFDIKRLLYNRRKRFDQKEIVLSNKCWLLTAIPCSLSFIQWVKIIDYRKTFRIPLTFALRAKLETKRLLQPHLENFYADFCRIAPGLGFIPLITKDGYYNFGETRNFNLLKGISIQFPDPQIRNRHYKRRIWNPKFAKAVAEHLSPLGHVFLQSDVMEVCEDMKRTLLDAQKLDFKECETGSSWLKQNPFEISTEWEAASASNKNIYRCILFKGIRKGSAFLHNEQSRDEI